MKTEYSIGELNGVKIIICKVTKGDQSITRPLTPTELQLLVDELNENQP